MATLQFEILCLTQSLLRWASILLRPTPICSFALPPFEVEQCHFSGQESKICTFLVAVMPFYLSNTQGL